MAKQARAHVTRETLVQAAGKVFSEQSYAQASLSDVLREAGVSQGALYFHFESKKVLAEAVIERQHQTFLDAGKALLQGNTAGLPAMIMLSKELAVQISTNPIIRGGLRLSTESPDVFADNAREPYEDWIAACEVLLNRAMLEGDVESTLDSATLAAFVIATFTGVQSLSRARTEWRDLNDRLEEMWLMLLTGIGATDRKGNLPDIHGLIHS